VGNDKHVFSGLSRALPFAGNGLGIMHVLSGEDAYQKTILESLKLLYFLCEISGENIFGEL